MSGTAKADTARGEPLPATLGGLFLCFFWIGLQSFGGGLAAWIRRAVVVRRGWIEDQRFLSGLALAQIAPGANAVNLTVYIGTELCGASGAVMALLGLMAGPLVIAMAVGALYLRYHTLPAVELMLTGLGAGAVGLNVANAIQLTGKTWRDPVSLCVLLVVAVGIGPARLPLIPVLLGMLPVSIGAHLLWQRFQR